MKFALIAALLLTCAGDAPAAPVLCAQKTYFQAHVWADPSIQFCEETQ